MRSYCIDELPEHTLQHLKAYLDEMNWGSSIPDLFWFPIEIELLEPIQREHEAKCGPYKMALEFTQNSVRLELLPRGMGNLHCECIKYLRPDAERKIMESLDTLLKEVEEDQVNNLMGITC